MAISRRSDYGDIHSLRSVTFTDTCTSFSFPSVSTHSLRHHLRNNVTASLRKAPCSLGAQSRKPGTRRSWALSPCRSNDCTEARRAPRGRRVRPAGVGKSPVPKSSLPKRWVERKKLSGRILGTLISPVPSPPSPSPPGSTSRCRGPGTSRTRLTSYSSHRSPPGKNSPEPWSSGERGLPGPPAATRAREDAPAMANGSLRRSSRSGA